MLDFLFDDLGFAVFLLGAAAVLVVLVLWIYASISSVGLVALTFLAAVICLGGLFLYLFEEVLGHEAL